MTKKAIIVGANGQDGTLLNLLLSNKNYQIVEITRNCETDIFDPRSVTRLLESFRPDEIYYLAAYHHSSQDGPPRSEELLELSYRTHVLGLFHFLEGIKSNRLSCKLFYAASSHVFGDQVSGVLNERSPITPRSIYGITKASGMQMCQMYREQCGIFAATGILFNHESKLRPEKFLSQKIVQAAKAIQAGKPEKLTLGNLKAVVDWGYAPDYVDAMRLILSLDSADDYVIATGIPHTVQDFVETAFEKVGLSWADHVIEQPQLLTRQTGALIGDPTHLMVKTGWKPSVNFEEMVHKLLE